MTLFKRKAKKPAEFLVLQNNRRKAVIDGDFITLYSITGKKHKGQCQKWPTTKIKNGIYEVALMWVNRGVWWCE